ncbi:ADP-dependent NAD(P)H-hydrate dehydratase [Agromyces aerolatus]|uniref:ADP-dependent NAD(P)H-hydrate dehydratase n=1 Tax=Agromyces sp. LY-1074 TaxID=3074080 RepID=UPI00285C39CF|nr:MULTISPECIES: ADP/ATP-dependent (S)-NAD(P)H-hydrate dehydratase [unclassified Agromyces]MDR5699814.1 ADP/ATP-dependent (S)-NAD(P)H-hydrate dehydratase [Agromyces sp. LY-1074]MDR5706374.1 ADP/ATP-dependent (S)-NAD(P)H-hydrate dehydratase [Agromyces sp. LY-1358]
MDDAAWQEWTAADAAGWIRRPEADDDKYRRGVLGVLTGSTEYPGAAVLGVEAAHRAGIGMVRYIGPRPLRAAVLLRRPETVTQSGRVQAWLLGSGMDASHRTFVLSGDLQHALASGVPVVLDAGGLDLVGTHNGPTVITPHARELAKLLVSREIRTTKDAVLENPAGWAAHAASELGVVVLLKGAVTHVADPGGRRLSVHAPTHWLATAGTGDVLGGVLGALVASHHDQVMTDATVLTRLAATAAFVHGEAGRLASERVDGGPIAALDVAEAVPSVIGRLLASSTPVE